MYRVDCHRATLRASLRRAAVAGPPSPEYPAGSPPATVVIVPPGSMRRTEGRGDPSALDT